MHEIRTEIEIHASPARAWHVLTDFAAMNRARKARAESAG